jgi:hypothetical protein
LSVQEALKMEQHGHSELRVATELVCDTLGAIQVRPRAGSLQGRLGVAFKRVRT